MRARRIIFAVMAIGGSLASLAQGAANLAEELLNTRNYLADATFEVLLPQSEDPVVYDITLQSEAMSDTLAPCNYLIRWASTSVNGPLEGFSAYFNGNHYRYRNNRLQEYHASANIDPFMPLGPGSESRGVQSTAQFADMLPQFIGAKIYDMIADSSYIYQWHPDTLVDGRRSIVIDGVKRGNGYDQMQYSYVFDYKTHLPVKSDIESSPGSISEQIVTITYSPDSEAERIDISEEGLMDQWPEVFERFRESTFRAENLVNTPLPAFSCKILDSSEHFAHHQDETLSTPMIIVVIDPTVSTAKSTISAIREAADSAPRDIRIVWAFNSNNTREITELLDTVRQGETALTSANSLIRNCGITLYPTTILVDQSSTVKDVISGFNNDLGLVVLQKAMLMK